MSDWQSQIPEVLLQSMCTIPDAPEYWVAFSGGLDSSVLLFLAKAWLDAVQLPERTDLSSVRPSIALKAIHVNHGLSKNADQWQAHCEAITASLEIPLTVEKVLVQPEGSGLEAAARQARYEAFARHIPGGAVLLQAHHLNDLAETLLLRLMRGAGAAGMAGIPRQRTIVVAQNASLSPAREYHLYRPLLDITRQQLEQAATCIGLDWVHDESNDSHTFSRNYLRHNVMPLLLQRWPSALESLAQVAENSAESEMLCRTLAESDLVNVGEGSTLNLSKLVMLPQIQQRNLVRYWLQKQGAGFPGRHQFERIWSELIAAREDASPVISWVGGELRRYRNQLYAILPATDNIDAGGPLLPGVPRLTAIGTLTLLKCGKANMADKPRTFVRVALHDTTSPQRLSADAFSIRFRQGGEKITLKNRGTKSLKKLFQEAAVPEWLRQQYPLIYYGDALVAIPGIGVAADFLPEPEDDSNQWVITVA